jgi:hypothetical protein
MKRRSKITADSEPETPLSQEAIAAYQLEIRAAWQKAVTSIIATGQLLQKIHAAIPWGERGRLYEGPNKPFSSRTAEMLIAIAAHPVISNPKHASFLPASWYCLFLLSELPPERLEQLIDDKTVRADMQRREVNELLRYEASRVRRANKNAMADMLDNTDRPAEHLSADAFLPGAQTVRPKADIGTTYRQLSLLVVDLESCRDQVRRDSSLRRDFIKLADRIMSIVEGDPVPVVEEMEAVQ